MTITSTVSYNTPEGISLELVPASFVPRAMAWLVDALVRGLIIVICGMVLTFLGLAGYGLMMLVYFVVFWFYPVLFEVFRDGQTIGKKTLKIRVCMDNGLPVSWQASMIRNLLIMADFLPFGFFAGLVASLFNKQSKRLGDIVAGTMVVYETNQDDIPIIDTRPPILPPMSLELTEQQAILMFAERADNIPEQRRLELADILTPLAGKTGVAMEEEIIGYANAIVGSDRVQQRSNKRQKSPKHRAGVGR